jgi:hypothetical protein
MNQPEYPQSKYNNSVAGAALSIGVKPETLELFVNQMREYDRAEREGDKPDSKLVYWWAYVEVYNRMLELSKKVATLEEQVDIGVKNCFAHLKHKERIKEGDHDAI